MSLHAPASAGDRPVRTPSPRREIARIAVPVSAEFVLTLLLQVVNQVIVGLLGAAAIAAVGFANSLSMILVLTLGALGASVSILVARAFGAGRQERLNRTVTAALLLAGGAGVVAAVPLLLWSGSLMRLVGASETVAAAGGGYLGFLGLALIPIVVGGLLSGVLRSTGHARSPMVATMGTVGLNAALAFALVTGFGPFPQLGVVGAGVATLVTATIKTGILAAQVFGLHRIVAWELPHSTAEWLPVARSLFVLAVPLGLTELFWTGGTFLYNVVFQQLGDDALAAAQIVNMLEALFLVGSIGLMSATTALVGREVGRGDAAAAAAWVRRIKKVGAVSGVAFGLLFGATALLLPVLFPEAGSDVRTMAVVGIAPVCRGAGGQGPQHDPRGRRPAQRQRRARRHHGRRDRSIRRGPAARPGARALHPPRGGRDLRGPGHRGGRQGGHLLPAHGPGPLGRPRGAVGSDAGGSSTSRPRGRGAGAAGLTARLSTTPRRSCQAGVVEFANGASGGNDADVAPPRFRVRRGGRPRRRSGSTDGDAQGPRP